MKSNKPSKQKPVSGVLTSQQLRALVQKRVISAKPAIEENEDTRPAQKKAFRPERTAKRPTNDALNAVRKFGDSPREIPATSYAADGTRRDIVIRPTSIQDVYYYSAPR